MPPGTEIFMPDLELALVLLASEALDPTVGGLVAPASDIFLFILLFASVEVLCPMPGGLTPLCTDMFKPAICVAFALVDLLAAFPTMVLGGGMLPGADELLTALLFTLAEEIFDTTLGGVTPALPDMFMPAAGTDTFVTLGRLIPVGTELFRYELALVLFGELDTFRGPLVLTDELLPNGFDVFKFRPVFTGIVVLPGLDMLRLPLVSFAPMPPVEIEVFDALLAVFTVWFPAGAVVFGSGLPCCAETLPGFNAAGKVVVLMGIVKVKF